MTGTLAPTRRCFDPGARTETICAWCGMTLSGGLPPLPDGSENYGMCRRCLSHRLWRLDHPRDEAQPLGTTAAAPEATCGTAPRRHADAA